MGKIASAKGAPCYGENKKSGEMPDMSGFTRNKKRNEMREGGNMSSNHGVDGASSLPTHLRFCPSKRYAEMHRRSLEDPERFWSEEARKLDWYKTWDRVLDWTPPYARWFVGGRLNA